MRFVPLLIGAALMESALMALPAQAVQFGFTNITNNSPTNAALGESVLGLDVNAVGTNQVSFTFTNTSNDPLSPVITQLYFDGNPTLASYISFNSFSDSTGTVGFQQVKTGVLPGGNGSLINFSVDYQANAYNPRPVNGIGGGESLTLLFDLTAGITFDDILTALSTGALRVGTHVQAFSNGGSESFINNPASQQAPEPLTLLGSAAAIAYGTLLQRQHKRKHSGSHPS